MNWRRYVRLITGPNGQVVYLVLLSTALCGAVIACERGDLAAEGIARARALTTGVEEQLLETKAELANKAKEIDRTIRRDLGMTGRKHKGGKTASGREEKGGTKIGKDSGGQQG